MGHVKWNMITGCQANTFTVTSEWLQCLSFRMEMRAHASLNTYTYLYCFAPSDKPSKHNTVRDFKLQSQFLYHNWSDKHKNWDATLMARRPCSSQEFIPVQLKQSISHISKWNRQNHTPLMTNIHRSNAYLQHSSLIHIHLYSLHMTLGYWEKESVVSLCPFFITLGHVISAHWGNSSQYMYNGNRADPHA